MKNIIIIRQKLKNLLPYLKKQYGVLDMGIFGSYVRGEETKKSDLDILVNFRDSISFLKFMELENYLSRELGIKIDLVMKNALKPRIGKHILKELIKL